MILSIYSVNYSFKTIDFTECSEFSRRDYLRESKAEKASANYFNLTFFQALICQLIKPVHI